MCATTTVVTLATVATNTRPKAFAASTSRKASAISTIALRVTEALVNMTSKAGTEKARENVKARARMKTSSCGLSCFHDLKTGLLAPFDVRMAFEMTNWI